MNAKFEEKWGRSHAIRAVENFSEAWMPQTETPKTKRDLFKKATMVLRHSIGFCEDLCVRKSADDSFDLQEIGTRNKGKNQCCLFFGHWPNSANPRPSSDRDAYQNF